MKTTGNTRGTGQRTDSDTGGRSERPSVLVVDDVKANLLASQAVLGGMSCEVVLAESGDEALRQLLRRKFAVMLLDVQMPHMDGYEVAGHVRSNPATSAVPIIFLTAGRGDEETALRAYGTGAVDFLLKPFNADILRSKVRVFLELWRKREELAEAKARLEGANRDLGEAYRELQEAQVQLVQTAKMASLGQLVAGVAHEINNPLSFIVSHLSTARRSLAAVHDESGSLLSPAAAKHWERAENRLDEIKLGLERIADLIVKLRTFSRLDEGEFKPISVRESIDALLTIVRHRLPRGVRVVTEFGEPDTIVCFSGLMNQAVMNLLVNAIDAIDDEGEIRIATGVQGDEYTIVVADSGCGIPSSVRERVFEPFFTTKGVGEGTGLGLSLAYSVVKNHQGTLTLEPGAPGTIARIKIPLQACQARE